MTAIQEISHSALACTTLGTAVSVMKTYHQKRNFILLEEVNKVERDLILFIFKSYRSHLAKAIRESRAADREARKAA